MEVKGRVAAVLGGAGGIGRAVAAALLGRGATVILADVDQELAKAVAAELDGSGMRCLPRRCDVRDSESLKALADEAAAAGRPVDLLVYMVGISVGGYPELIPPEAWAQVIDVNVTGAARAVAAFVPRMLSADGGWIALVSSTMALHPASFPLSVPYVTSKTALLAMGAGLDASLRQRGVGVSVLAPGMTDTAFAAVATRWLPEGPVQVQADLRGADEPAAVAAGLLDGIEAGELLVTMPSWDRTHERVAADFTGPVLYVRQRAADER